MLPYSGRLVYSRRLTNTLLTTMLRKHPANSIAILALALLTTTGVPLRGATIVLDQLGDVDLYNLSAAPGPRPSQFFTDFPLFDNVVIDDFSVTSDELRVTHVSALFRAQGGFIGFQDVEGYSVNVFSDPELAGVSLIGDIAHSFVSSGEDVSVTEVFGAGAEYGLVSLDVYLLLPSAGTYWIGVSPKSSFSVTWQFFLMDSGAAGASMPGNLNARLANPSEGLGSGPLTELSVDAAYSVTAAPEPTSTALFMIGGVCMIIRRQRIPSRSQS